MGVYHLTMLATARWLSATATKVIAIADHTARMSDDTGNDRRPSRIMRDLIVRMAARDNPGISAVTALRGAPRSGPTRRPRPRAGGRYMRGDGYTTGKQIDPAKLPKGLPPGC